MNAIAPYLGVLKVLVALALVGAIFYSGTMVEGWRKDAEIAAMKEAQAKLQLASSERALNQLTEAASIVHSNATAAMVNVESLRASIDKLSKEFRNAQPLPADCRPDDFRMRHLSDAVRAVQAALAGQPARGTVPDPGAAGGR